ncbi:mechanosensitive ion channel [Actinomycetaceae bacterium TAE3-ERU4]|nr:mechanosensitive ion channel [Actinomycetaceae bacterium TAE3-ERU4]
MNFLGNLYVLTYPFGVIAKKGNHSPEGAGKVAEEAVETTVNIATLLGSSAIGAVVGFVVGLLVFLLIRLAFYRSKPGRLLAHRLRLPIPILFLLVGASVALDLADSGLSRNEQAWVDLFQHGFLLAVIAAITWVLVAAVQVIEDVANHRYSNSIEGKARRVTTQMQILRRVLQAILVALGIIVAILTFPQARTAMTALLSSAGVISIIAGIAAQNVLGNMFAGLQIAFADSVRVGDILVFDDKYGTVEEITLTYVVLRIWDEKRLVIPSRQLTEKSVENWTRRHAQVLGTVELPLDWTAPVPAIRLELQRLLQNSPLWDGNTGNIQITDSQAGQMTVRVCVSAANPSDLWDLRCYVREHLVDWTVRNAPYALTRTRLQREEVKIVEHDKSDEEVARLAEELALIAGPLEGENKTTTSQDTYPQSTAELVAQAERVAGGQADPFVLARLKAAHHRSKRERRKANKKRQELEKAEKILEELGEKAKADADRTSVLSPADVAKLRQAMVEKPVTEKEAKPAAKTDTNDE